ncbi:DNA repair and recombination protein RAD54B [Angomonas deanei]|uniref:Type III restriction enzyme, res subunit/SNF2 family N-terminal domain/DEAD/DEAH box helicase/Helicase conserved C-terminal domain containing protein, putative n=1 Tax=Angomonas deanei TaxID=59799 RepID=A0A7G2CLH1_9TRYP|nr:DNA repair and recombination protein RAD54B [Angomonas deanei]CAD2219907.1 Type III restriction enzyme, res subunit/SNF2 family N-terminal domain/DEAD/DEAH box helicase/Helicase conserved C-terminal domain containing protein, putative [Angomonas deanei]|eukprot:EPY24404.1 DNA repair and recombination protein RAD54B [Angomonas deanei]
MPFLFQKETAHPPGSAFRAPFKSHRRDAPTAPLGDTAVPHFLRSRTSSRAPEDGASEGGRRTVFYPEASTSTSTAITQHRMERRKDMDYHQVEPVTKKKKLEGDTTANTVGGAKDPFLEADGPQDAKAETTESNAEAKPAEDGEAKKAEEEEEELVVVPRYPVSPHGKLYFQVEGDGGNRHESVGIIIIDVEEQGVMMYDRVGRQFGNRIEPGYPIKQEEIDNVKAGQTLKVGTKTVLVMTALLEEVFRSGEFFLRSEHDLRIKEDKRKAEKEAVDAEVKARPKMSFGTSLTSLFTPLRLRKRPTEGATGFIVPLAGRPKVGKNGLLEDLTPLHDPDRPNAVVLFRADYKRDMHGRRQVSVVVDPVIGDKLRPHQRQGVKFLFDCINGERMPGYHGAILADEMGLGKTIQTVATIYTCLRQGKRGVPTARKCLVVTPSSLVKNWCNEFDKWLGEGVVKHFAISESTPKGDRIISRFDGEGDVLVISYDQLRKYVTRLCTLKCIELVVCDEGHRLKNSEVKTTKAVDMLPTRNRIILSGTPVQNDLSEFHAMVGFVNPGILGNRDLFNRVFAEPIDMGRDPESDDYLRSLGRDRAHYLSVLTQKFILRRTQAINESYLPPKVDVTVFVRLGEQQQRTYDKLASLVGSCGCTPLVLISALRKLCNHMDLFYDAVKMSNENANKQKDDGEGKRRGREGKGIPREVLPPKYKPGDLSITNGSKIHFVSLMLDELRRNGERDKLVIASNFTQTLSIIAALCDQKRVGYFQLDGSTPIKKRQELVDYFNVPFSQETVFLLSSKAGGVGLNLIGANRLILFDPDWNPANDAQAMGRVWRDGQQKRVFIYRLLSTGSIEEKIYQRQVSKQGLSANVVDMQEDSNQHFTLDELKALFKFTANTLSETHDLLDCTECEAAVSMGVQEKLKAKKLEEARNVKFRKVSSGEKKKSGPRMDELKAWRHISEIASFALDKVLQSMAKAAPSLVSFVFADERDNTKDKTR